MHDPRFVAFEVRRPWPQRTTWRRDKRWDWSPPFFNAAGRGFYFPGYLIVWHREPGDRDAGEVCGYPHGLELLRHLRHLELQVVPIQIARRWLFTRCAWCGGPSRFRQGRGINLRSPGGLADDDRADLPWWHGEQGLLHWECSSVADAWRHCVCPVPDLRTREQGYGWSWCSLCGKSRFHETDVARQLIYEWVRAHTDYGRRPSPEVSRELTAKWKLYRAAKELEEAADG